MAAELIVEARNEEEKRLIHHFSLTIYLGIIVYGEFKLGA